MTCSALAKLLVVLLMGFILCLPEFFSDRGFKVSFCCESFKPCAEGSDGNCGRSEGMWVKDQPTCSEEANSTEQSNSSYWLLCETQTNLTNLTENSSPVEPLQVSLVVQIDSPLALNVTFHYHLDNSSLLIKSSERHLGLFHCCMSPNQSQDLHNLTSAPNHCFLLAQLSNQTETLEFPHQMKGSGRYVSKHVWLALVISVTSVIVVMVLYQAVCKTWHLRRRVERLPDSGYQPSQLIIRQTTTFDDIPDLSLQHRGSTGDVFSEVPCLEEEGGDVFSEVPCLEEEGGDVFSEVPCLEEKGEPLFQVYRFKKGLSPIREIENH